MIRINDHKTLPGWRDFERASALAFNGLGGENKFFVDVIFPFTDTPLTFYGIDCKMRRELKLVDRTGVIYIEVTNAANWLWSHLNTKGINEANYTDRAEAAGMGLIEAIESIKQLGSSAYPEGPILTEKSYYFVLQWSLTGDYQLFQLPLTLPTPDDLAWYCHVSSKKSGAKTTRLVGRTSNGVLYEWYGDSGGQFKYYPSISQAVWQSKRFRLEPISEDVESGIVAKARIYFPDLWRKATQ